MTNRNRKNKEARKNKKDQQAANKAPKPDTGPQSNQQDKKVNPPKPQEPSVAEGAKEESKIASDQPTVE